MAASGMIALEATIVSTAMPQIVSELGGLRLYSWVFSSFLLAQTATTVIFGKLADIYGRKPMLMIGIGIFLFGSVFAGLAWSMPAMILFRVIQGLGAGAIQPVGMTVVGDLYPVEKRGKIQGYLASIWAICAVAGPLAGGLIIRDFSWSWIFWINIGWADNNFSPKSPQCINFFFRLLIGRGKYTLITFNDCRYSQSHSCITRCAFNDRTSRFQ